MANEKLLQTAKDNLDKLGDALGKKVGTAVESGDSSTKTSLDTSTALANLKNSITTTILDGTNITVPAEAYEKFAQAVYEKFKSNSGTKKYSTDDKKLTQQILGEITSGLGSIPNKKVNTKYTLNFKLSASSKGQSVISANLVSNGKTVAMLTSTTNSNKALAEYCAALYQLGQDVTNKVWKSVVNIFKKNAVSLFKEIYSVGGTDSALKKILGNSLFKQITKAEIKSKVNGILSSSANKKIATAVTNYENLNTAYNNLVSEVNSSKSTVKTIKTKSTAFTTAANKVKNSLKSLGVTVSLDTLPTPSIGLSYDKNNTAVTVPAGYASELKTADYKSSVKMIYAGDFTKAVTINGNAKDNTVFTGDGNDKIYGLGGNDGLYGGKGNDAIYGGAKNDSLYGGAGNDSLFGEADTDKLFGEAGNDTLVGGKGNDTLTGGKGKDIFYYSNGDGTDTITDYTAGDDKIYLASGSIKSSSMDSKGVVTFKVGSGSIKVQNVKGKEITVVMPDKTESKYLNGKLTSSDGSSNSSGGVNVNNTTTNKTINGTSYNDTIKNSSSRVIINTAAGKDSIWNYGGQVKIDGGDGNDSIYSDVEGSIEAGSNITMLGGKGDDFLDSDSAYSTLFGGDGNDTIINYGWNVSINGGSGNDRVENRSYFDNEGSNVTLVGGKGNDAIYMSGYKNVISYASGDGSDVVYNLGSTDTISITGGSYTRSTVGSDVVLKVGSGAITVKGGKNSNFNVKGTLAGGGGSTNSTVKANIPSGASTYNGHSYKLFNDGMTWNDAKVYCENLGGHLVTITDSDEQTFVGSLLVKGSKNSYWIGCKLSELNKMAWITEEKMIYSNWNVGEPDNYQGKQGYGFILNISFNASNIRGKWGDIQNDGDSWDHYYPWGLNNFGFICEWDSTPLASSADLAEDFWFMDAASPDVSDLDSLMNELPTENVSVNDFSTGTADNSFKLLDGVTFAQASNKN